MTSSERILKAAEANGGTITTEQVNKMKDRIKQAKKENASDNMIQMGKKGNHIEKF